MNVNFLTYNDKELAELTLQLIKQTSSSDTLMKKWIALVNSGARLDVAFGMHISTNLGQRDDVLTMQTSALEVMLTSWPLTHISQALVAIGPIPDVILPHLSSLMNVKNLGRPYDDEYNKSLQALAWTDMRYCAHQNKDKNNQDNLGWITPWDVIISRSFDPVDDKMLTNPSFYQDVHNVITHLPPLRQEHASHINEFHPRVQSQNYLGYWMAHVAKPNAYTSKEIEKAFHFYEVTQKEQWWDVATAHFQQYIISKECGAHIERQSSKKQSKI